MGFLKKSSWGEQSRSGRQEGAASSFDGVLENQLE